MSRADGIQQPNLVLVVVDDLGWRDLGCYASTFYESPNIDRMAAEGALFTDGYAASPLCSPSRASILSGKFAAHVGMTTIPLAHHLGRLRDVPSMQYFPLDEICLARPLRNAGYRTWHVGKWHLGGPAAWPEHHGFEINIAGSDRGMSCSHISPYDLPNLDDGPPGEYLADRLTDEAINLIQQSHDGPFFLNLWHYGVHIPLQAPEELVEKYRRKAAGLGLDKREPFSVGEHFPTWMKRDQRIRRRLFQSEPVYAAMIENLDANIGRLLRALDELDRSTLVIFTSDNGGLATAEGSPTCNAPLSEGKGWTAEGGLRVPFIVRWPGRIAAGQQIGQPVIGADIYPTFLDAAAVPAPDGQDLDGASILPILNGGKAPERMLLWHFPHYSPQGGRPSAAIRIGDHKLIRDFETGRQEVYAIRSDLGETRDLGPTHPDLLHSLETALDSWLRGVDACIPAPGRTEPLPGTISRDEYYEPTAPGKCAQ